MDEVENMENIDPTMDIEMRSSSYSTPSPFKPACWPTSPVFDLFLNSKARISSTRTLTTTPGFPPLLPTPTGPPLRVQPQLPALHSLDVKNLPASSFLTNGSESEQGDPQSQAITNPPVREFDSARNDTHNREAIQQLQAHIKERIPYVHLASSRLQAAMRMRNELPFQLPQVLPNPAPKSMRRASARMNITPDTGGKTTFKARGRTGARAAVKSIKKPMKMHTVDQETGRGLREFLLAKGKELGHKKIKCKSVSIHDFTPDMRTMAYQNVLLGHYDTERGARVDIFEVDLPTVTTDQITGEVTSGSETWLWILIQRPIVSFDESDTSSHVPSYQGSPDLDAPTSTSPGLANPPPNFPKPIPLSWVVFAAPLAHVTAYPESVEKVPDSPHKIKWGGRGKRVHKRADYDFSHDGVPLFEFSSAGLFQGHRTEFLSVEKIGGHCAGDGYMCYSEEEYNDMCQQWLESGGSEEGGFKKMPCPNEGVWWAEFYKRVGEDCDTWQRVKRAMEKGKCRVVLRWLEYEEAGEDEDEGGRGDDGDMDSDNGPVERKLASGRKEKNKRATNSSEGVYETAKRMMMDQARLYSPAGMIPSMAPGPKTTRGRKK